MLKERVFQGGVASESVSDGDVSAVEMFLSSQMGGSGSASPFDSKQVVVISGQATGSVGVNARLQQGLCGGEFGQVRMVGMGAFGGVHDLLDPFVTVIGKSREGCRAGGRTHGVGTRGGKRVICLGGRAEAARRLERVRATGTEKVRKPRRRSRHAPKRPPTGWTAAGVQALHKTVHDGHHLQHHEHEGLRVGKGRPLGGAESGSVEGGYVHDNLLDNDLTLSYFRGFRRRSDRRLKMLIIEGLRSPGLSVRGEECRGPRNLSVSVTELH